MELTTARLVLREIEESDYAALLEMYRDPEMRRFEGALLDASEMQQNMQNFLADRREQPRTHFRLAITIPPEDRACGWVTLTLIHPAICEYEIGWAVHRPAWGKGYATEAARALMHYAFTQLNAHRVIALTHPENRASVRVMEKLGMQREGLLRQTHPFGSGWCDELVYGMLDNDYPRSSLDM